MDLLRAEIANKRKFIEQNNLIDERKKFFKREELNKKIEDEYWAKQNDHYEKKSREKNNFDQSDIKNSNSKDESFYGKTPEEIAAIKLKKIIENPSNERSSNETESDERILPRKEVVKRLRERNQPILLFGESESDAFRRLRKLEILEPDSTEKGFRNDFQEAMEKVDAAYLEEIVKSGGSFDSNSDKKRGKNDVKIEEMNTSIDEIIQEAKYLGRQRSNHKVRLDEARRKSDCSIISKFLKYLLELWGRKLNDRNESEKRSTQGRLLTAIYTQTQDYLKPMFKQLTKETIAEDILKHLILIVKHLLERDYVKANDAYLQMAIGNAPWPIGVTMVGIHARTGREKIFAQNIAHVLNDETQRKYIQALKRLMTQCQKMFPTDPSRCVEYTKQ